MNVAGSTSAGNLGQPESRSLNGSGDACDGVIHFGNVDWWYHNRGHASTRMATRLARQVPTVWMNSIAMRAPRLGHTELAWQRYIRKARSLIKGLRRDPETGMWIYSTLFIPRYTARCLDWNGHLLAAQVRWVCRRLKIQRPSALVSIPTVVPAIEQLDWVNVVFDRCDDFTTMPGINVELIRSMENRLLDRCDYAVYVNTPLYERERNRVNAHFIGHGVDFEAFAQARPVGGPTGVPPKPLGDLPRPIVGFYGGLDEYRMDLELMIKVAKHVPHGSVLIIGPKQMDLSPLEVLPNVTFLGQLLPSELPEYAAQFDVGMIPFLRNEFNLHCNPTKLNEYLALAFPIVATRLPAFESHEDLMYLAETHEEFLKLIDRALEETDQTLPQRRRDAVAGQSWDVVTGLVAQRLGVPMA